MPLKRRSALLLSLSLPFCSRHSSSSTSATISSHHYSSSSSSSSSLPFLSLGSSHDSTSSHYIRHGKAHFHSMPSIAGLPAAPHANLKQASAPYIPFSRSRAPATTTDYDSSNSLRVRKYLRTYGLMPPTVESFDIQLQRCLNLLANKSSPIEKYMYLTHLRNTNTHLFYRLLAENIRELTPIIYTPTVGEACVRWSEIYTQPEGLYLSYADKGHLHTVINNWHKRVAITVVTDGSRILGLGDLGVNGMGIPIGKLALYTACAGIRPDKTLPLTIDLGTNNEALWKDPFYMGSRQPRVSAAQEEEFMDELMAVLTEKWPGIVIQFEDFKNPFPSLERYRGTFSCFNDDIQGTGAVILGGFINAVKSTGIHPKDQRAVFLGAGSAGVGVAKQLVTYFMKEGLSEDEARRKFWLVDSKGLVTNDRGDELADHKVYFSRDDNKGVQIKSLADVVEYVKPTILMGLSTIGGAFTKEIITRMGELNEKPVIFPLSNPSANSECTFEEAVKYTGGRAIFASGSPFQPLEYEGKILSPGQGNNMYVFPGIGMGAILSKAVIITDEMIYASAEALASSLSPEEAEAGWLYPDLTRIRQVSVVVTRGVIRAAQASHVDRELALRNLTDAQLDQYIRDRMYDANKEGEILTSEVKSLMSSIEPNL